MGDSALAEMSIHERLFDLAQKYNLPLSVILTALAITDQVYSEKVKMGDIIEEPVEDSIKKTTESEIESKIKSPSDCKVEENCDSQRNSANSKFQSENKSPINEETSQTDLIFSLGEITVIILIACKIHNIPPLIPRIPDNELHSRIESKIIKFLNFNLSIPDTASIMTNISDKLLCTNAESMVYLERLLVVHMDKRIRNFRYFSMEEYSSSHDSTMIPEPGETNNEEFYNKILKNEGGTPTQPKIHQISLEQTDYISQYDKERLAFFPLQKKETRKREIDSNSKDLSSTRVFECCLSILDEEDLVRYEITMGENRPQSVSQIRKSFCQEIPYIIKHCKF